jgi:hypothetical protein
VFDGQNYLLETTGVTNQIEVAYAVDPQTYGIVVSKTDASSTLYYHVVVTGSTHLAFARDHK